MLERLLDARFAMLALAAGVIGWLLVPVEPEQTASIVRSQRDDWSGQEVLRRPSLTTQAMEVASAGLWGVQSQRQEAMASAPPEDTRWRIAGLFGQGAERRALVVFLATGKAPQYVKVGDTLPSGHKIASISDRDVCVQIGKRAYRVAVQRADS